VCYDLLSTQFCHLLRLTLSICQCYVDDDLFFSVLCYQCLLLVDLLFLFLVPIYHTLEIYVDRDSSSVTTTPITSCARGDTIYPRPLHVLP